MNVASAHHEKVISALLTHGGGTYAHEADVALKDTPAPLFRLLMLSLLFSNPISADIAVEAARELRSSGLSSAPTTRDARRSDVIAALDRAHYVRYDESTATRLRELSVRVERVYEGDLRRLADRADQSVPAAKRLLEEFNGIGPTGADIFLREVQAVWPWVRPYFDTRALESASSLGLPCDVDELAKYVPPDRLAELSAALVRISLDKQRRGAVDNELG